MKREINVNKRYIFPSNIKAVNYDGCKIIISVDTAKWIILRNNNQQEFWSILQNNTIKEALKTYKHNIDDAIYVITQIEGRDFTNPNVIKCVDPKKQVLHIYLTNSCNLHCPHCYMYAGKSLDNELTTEEIKDMLFSFKNNGGANITFSGGEISLRKDLQELVEFAHGIGLSIRLLTNGTLWRRHNIEIVSKHIHSIQISIDGFDEKSNSKIRGKNNFTKSLQTIDAFINAGVNTEIAITPFYDDDLEKHIMDYAIFAKQLTDKYANKSILIKFANQMLEGREIKMSPQQQNNYNSIINKIYSIYYQQDIADYPFIAAFQEPKIMNNCMYGELSIAANGDVYFCSRIPSTSAVTNIRTTSFERIMELSKVAQQKSDISNLRPCNDCELKYICGGGCRIDYFPSFARCEEVISMDLNNIEPRVCNLQEKEKYYQLMIKTNDKLLK